MVTTWSELAITGTASQHLHRARRAVRDREPPGESAEVALQHALELGRPAGAALEHRPTPIDKTASQYVCERLSFGDFDQDGNLGLHHGRRRASSSRANLRGRLSPTSPSPIRSACGPRVPREGSERRLGNSLPGFPHANRGLPLLHEPDLRRRERRRLPRGGRRLCGLLAARLGRVRARKQPGWPMFMGGWIIASPGARRRRRRRAARGGVARPGSGYLYVVRDRRACRRNHHLARVPPRQRTTPATTAPTCLPERRSEDGSVAARSSAPIPVRPGCRRHGRLARLGADTDDAGEDGGTSGVSAAEAAIAAVVGDRPVLRAWAVLLLLGWVFAPSPLISGPIRR